MRATITIIGSSSPIAVEPPMVMESGLPMPIGDVTIDMIKPYGSAARTPATVPAPSLERIGISLQ
jgi:hypothetical protein